MLDAYIFDGTRTPIGRYGGKLAPVRPDDMLGSVLRALVDKNPFKPEDIEDMVIGCANQGGEDSRCIARHAGLLAGLPIELGGSVVQRNCASGLNAIVNAAHAITAGEGDLFLVGGVESMSRAPFVMAKSDSPYSRDLRVYDSTIGSRFPNPRIIKEYGDDTMPQTADNLAKDFSITREQADKFAFASQQKYATAKGEGFFAGEITAVKLDKGRKAEPEMVSEDEHPRPQTDMAALTKLKTLFDGGVTTAGNASGVNDGAAALFIGSLEAGEKAGKKPIARILATGAAGVPPRIMGFGPAPASKKLLSRLGLTVRDLSVLELNEAFASQVLAALRDLDVADDDERVNPNGGAIALGHPLGMSGARLVLTAAYELRRRQGRFALCTMCIGVGQGIAMLIERV